MAYNGTVELIAGITPKNNGNFKLVNAKDVYVSDSMNLSQALDALKSFDYTICSTNATTPAGVGSGSLAASASTMNKIYLVKIANSGNDAYAEYITIQNGNSYSWEKIGDTTVALTDYPTKSDIGNITVTSPLKKTVSNGMLTKLEIDTMSNASTPKAGVVPAPPANDSTKFLRSDGQWVTVEGGGSAPDLTNYPTKYEIGAIPLRTYVVSGGMNSFKISKTVDQSGFPTAIDFTLTQMVGATDSANGIAGLVPAPTQSTSAGSRFLSADGTWKSPFSTLSVYGVTPASASLSTAAPGYLNLRVSVSTMGGASSNNSGSSGVVPAPSSGDQNKFLRGDGTWAEVQQGGGSVTTSNIECKKVHITIPANSLQYTYGPDSWVTADTDCYAHNMAMNSNISMSIAWDFSDSYITFTPGTVPSTNLEFDFSMVKITSQVSGG